MRHARHGTNVCVLNTLMVMKKLTGWRTSGLLSTASAKSRGDLACRYDRICAIASSEHGRLLPKLLHLAHHFLDRSFSFQQR